MKRNTIKEVDRYSWATSISLLILFITLSNTLLVFNWAENFETLLYDYIGSWSFLYTPLVLFALFSFQVSVIFIFIFSRIRSLEITISAAIYGSFIFYLGDPSNFLMQATLATFLGVILHIVILRFFSRLSSILPCFVESQNWQGTSLKSKISEPGYWAVTFNIFFTLSIVAAPLIIVQTWSSTTISIKIFIYLGSASILLGIHLLKKELIIGYLIYSIPYACILYFLISNLDLIEIISQNNDKLLIQNIGNFTIFLFITAICLANWKRLKWRP